MSAGATVELPIHVGRLEQLFDSMDPTPFRERDLDPRAEESIADWAREQRADARLALRVHLPGGGDTALVQGAVARHFRTRAQDRRGEGGLPRRGGGPTPCVAGSRATPA